MNKVPRWVFRYVGNKTFDFSSKKKDFLPKNDQIWPKTGIFGQFGPGHAGLFNALSWVGWWLWRAGCISQDTYLLYRIFSIQFDVFKSILIRQDIRAAGAVIKMQIGPVTSLGHELYF